MNIFSEERIRDYQQQTQFIHDLSNKFTNTIIGYVNYESIRYPIYKITYNGNISNSQKKYLVICGVHGNEPAPVYAIKEFLLELNSSEINKVAVTVDFIYILNPWGF